MPKDERYQALYNLAVDAVSAFADAAECTEIPEQLAEVDRLNERLEALKP